MKITIIDEIKEIEREIKVREKIYPHWVLVHKISKATAEKRINCLKATLDRLKRTERSQGEQKTFL